MKPALMRGFFLVRLTISRDAPKKTAMDSAAILDALRRQYHEAQETYARRTKTITAHLMSGAEPSEDELQEQKHALHDLAHARRQFFDALRLLKR